MKDPDYAAAGATAGYLAGAIALLLAGVYWVSVIGTGDLELLPVVGGLILSSIALLSVYAINRKRTRLMWPIAASVGAFALFNVASGAVLLALSLYVVSATALTLDERGARSTPA